MYYVHRHYYVRESPLDDSWLLECGRGTILRWFKSRYQANRFRLYLQNLLDACKFDELVVIHERFSRYHDFSFKSLTDEYLTLLRGR